MKTSFLLAVITLISTGGDLSAQAAADSGSFLVLRGPDTVATERFVRTATKLEGTLNIRNTKGTSERYAAVLAPDGSVPLIEVTVQEGADSGTSQPRIVQRARVIFKEDSAAVDEIGRSGLVTRVMGTESGAIPYLNLSFALIEQAVRRARAANHGSSVPFFNLGGGQTLVARLSPISADSVRMDIGDTRYDLRFNPDGRLLGARIPMQNVVVDRR
ncbi:MAG: hypothetical protein ACJ8AP_11860 [Gemmatimonadales bacterium]